MFTLCHTESMSYKGSGSANIVTIIIVNSIVVNAV